MKYSQNYVVSSLEQHLFFARIMKEHSLFLEAAFTPQGACLAREAENYKVQFEKLLYRAVCLSDCIVTPRVLNSGEIVTDYTLAAEHQTQKFTGIPIDKKITEMELRLHSGINPIIDSDLVLCVKQLNQISIKLLDGLIGLKQRILNSVLTCQLFTMNYPLLIEHILREAKLYRTCIMSFENALGFDCQSIKQAELFWNQIMMEHALFIRGLLDPSENELIETSNEFAQDYARLLAESREVNDMTMINITGQSLAETLKFREFKRVGTEGIQDCKIRSIILPLLADHVLREANHYIRILTD